MDEAVDGYMLESCSQSKMKEDPDEAEVKLETESIISGFEDEALAQEFRLIHTNMSNMYKLLKETKSDIESCNANILSCRADIAMLVALLEEEEVDHIDGLPCKTKDGLMKYDKTLNDPAEMKKLVKYLDFVQIGCSNGRLNDRGRRVMNAVMTLDVAQEYTFKGWGNKDSFKALNVYQAVCRSLVKNLGDFGTKIYLQMYFKNAPWNGGKRRKQNPPEGGENSNTPSENLENESCQQGDDDEQYDGEQGQYDEEQGQYDEEQRQYDEEQYAEESEHEEVSDDTSQQSVSQHRVHVRDCMPQFSHASTSNLTILAMTTSSTATTTNKNNISSTTTMSKNNNSSSSNHSNKKQAANNKNNSNINKKQTSNNNNRRSCASNVPPSQRPATLRKRLREKQQQLRQQQSQQESNETPPRTEKLRALNKNISGHAQPNPKSSTAHDPLSTENHPPVRRKPPGLKKLNQQVDLVDLVDVDDSPSTKKRSNTSEALDFDHSLSTKKQRNQNTFKSSTNAHDPRSTDELHSLQKLVSGLPRPYLNTITAVPDSHNALNEPKPQVPLQAQIAKKFRQMQEKQPSGRKRTSYRPDEIIPDELSPPRINRQNSRVGLDSPPELPADCNNSALLEHIDIHSVQASRYLN